MAGNSFGTLFKITTFGESHGAGLGVVIDGCPAGIPVSEAAVQEALDRRRPGMSNPAATTRKEPDACEILSGIYEGKTTGTSIAVLIRNMSQHSADYDKLKASFRPGHADYTYTAKYGFRDHRGGGRASGRETAARVAAGAVAQALVGAALGKTVSVTAYTVKAGGIAAGKRDMSAIGTNFLRCPDTAAAKRMEERIAELRRQGDSCGGIVECRIDGMPPGLGEPVFDKLDAQLAKAMLSIGAVKAFEMGEGFACADMTGSEMNDPMRAGDGAASVRFETNRAGGVLGGISSGQQILFRIAVKPVPSIFKTQRSVETDQNGNYRNTDLHIQGRHDVCLCPRIIPAAEAMVWIVLADMYLLGRCSRI